MSALTPGQAARARFTGLDSSESNSPLWDAVAAAVIASYVGPDDAVVKTPGQVLAESCGYEWASQHEPIKVTWENRAAAVIANVVGESKTIVSKDDLSWMLDRFLIAGPQRSRLREALA